TTAGNTTYSPNHMVYISRYSDIGILQSWTSDRIYSLCAHSTLSSNRIYYYDVTATTWSIANSSIPAASSTEGTSMDWDVEYNLYLTRAKVSYFYKYNIVTDSWSAVNQNTFDGSDVYYSQVLFADQQTNQISVDTYATSYWLVGDKDSIKIVTKDDALE